MGPFPEPSPYDLFAAEERSAPWATPALFGYVVIAALSLLGAWAEGSSFRSLFDNLRTQAQTGVAHLQSTPSLRIDELGLLTLAIEVPVFVLLLTWQYRAAKTARSLFLPAKLVPCLGVGGRFIPIANFWLPYQAIRDCLSPDDPARTGMARMWAFYVAGVVLDLVATVLAYVGTPVAFAFGAAALVAGIGFALHGSHVVRSIMDAHRRLLYPGRYPSGGSVVSPG
jgi:hypothetical protein